MVGGYTRPMRAFLNLTAAFGLVLLLQFGCRAPNQANIELRKQNQELRTDVSRLRAEVDQLKSDIRRFESSAEVLPTLPQERLEQLWTVAGVSFGRLTG